jgi:hypothetical protein
MMHKTDHHLIPNRGRSSGPTSLTAVAIVSLACILGGCSNGVSNAQNQDCAEQAHGNLPWGYYPGFGCGPVSRAQTLYP